MESKKPLVTSALAMFSKKPKTKNQEIEETKVKHRSTLEFLVDDYLHKLQIGDVEGIRHAKDLMDVIKMDMLLLGEATERTESNSLDVVKVEKIQQILDEDDPAIAEIISKLSAALNQVNDDED